MTIVSTPVEILLRKQKALRRELLSQSDLREVRIAVLSGSTTHEVADLLELLLLEQGLRPIFHQSEYSRYFEDSVIDPSSVIDFRPDIALVYTSSINVQEFAPLEASGGDLNAYVSAEVMRFAAIWNSLDQNVGCLTIQNNFELPTYQLLG